MNKCTVLSLVSVAAMLFAPAAFSQGVTDGSANPYHVVGEKLDSGLGKMAARRAEAMGIPSIDYHVAGESLDSGLGELTPADVAVYADPYHVAGEKRDSGLGELTAADIQVYMNPNHVAGEKLDSGLGELTARRVPDNTAVIRASF